MYTVKGKHWGVHGREKNTFIDTRLMAYLNANIPPIYCKIRKEYLYDMDEKYKEIKIKNGATFNKFFLIPDAAHFNVIENPKACAAAIYNFINIKFNLNLNI